MNLVQECYCVHCGASNEADQRRCFACGYSLKTTQPLPSVPSTPLLKERYRLLELVGEGGFSTVHKAEDMQDGRMVAIKTTSLRGLTSLEQIEATDAFNREVSLLSQLKQRHLPRIYDHFSDSTCWYLVMEFIDGITLEEYVRGYGAVPLPLGEVLDLGLLLCDVLSYLHNCQPAIIFRDLKPANVMLTRDGHLFLIDFGIARRFTPGKARDTIPFGSPGYAAPEQYGRGQTGPRSDIYSLGAILHQLLSGQNPTHTPFAFAPLPRQDCPELLQLNRLIQQMVSLKVEQRPEDLSLVKQELEQIALQRRQAPGLRRSTSRMRPPYTPKHHLPVISFSSFNAVAATGQQSQAQVMAAQARRQSLHIAKRGHYCTVAGLVLSLISPFYPFFLASFISLLISAHSVLAVLPQWVGVTMYVLEPFLAVILSSIGLYYEKTVPGLQTKKAVSAWPGLFIGIFFLALYILAFLVLSSWDMG